MNNDAAHIRVSERPDFVPLRTGDSIPDALRAALNVTAFLRDLQQAALQHPLSSLKGEPKCISISK